MKKITKLLVAGAALTAAMSASATTISFDDLFSDVEGNGGGTLNLTQFDSSLGTLQSVQFELVDKLTGFVQVENTGPTGGTFVANMTGTLHSAFGDLNAVANNTFVLPAYDKHLDYAGTSGVTYDIGQVSQTYSNTYTGAPELLLFTGNGAVQVAVTGEVTPYSHGSGNASYYSEGTIDAYAKVTYTYQTAPVPEPETYAMLLTGLGLMGAVLRKRKAS